jgi:hypothetical protein
MAILSDYFKQIEQSGLLMEFKEQQPFLDYFQNSDSLKNAQFTPDELKSPSPHIWLFKIENKTFDSVSFSKTRISNLSFKNCKFIKCLFIATSFMDCEFHDCHFSGCDLRYMHFSNTYINPKSLLNNLDRLSERNIGARLYSNLRQNLRGLFLNNFANEAEYQYRIWYRLDKLNSIRSNWKDYKIKKDGNAFLAVFKDSWDVITNFLYYSLAQYGLKSKFMSIWAICTFLSFILINFLSWNSYFSNIDLLNKGLDPSMNRTLYKVFHYTYSNFTSLGYNEYFIPRTSYGIVMASVQAILGIILLSAFVTYIINKITKT